MSVTVRIDEKLYSSAKEVSRGEHRSIRHQIEFWVMIGKCVLDNPELPTEFVKELLIAKQQDQSLAEPFKI